MALDRTLLLGGGRGFVFDVDGTLVHRAGDEVHVQPGAVEVFERIRASGRPLAGARLKGCISRSSSQSVA